MSAKSPRRAFSGILAIAVAFAVAACGGQSDDGGGSDDDAGTLEGGGTGTLEVGVSNIPMSPDPGQHGSVEALGILDLVAGTLTEQNPDGHEVSTGLAASVEPGDEHVLVELKPDLTFSDGSELDSTDVVASFEYLLADETNAHRHHFEAVDRVTAVDELTVAFELKQPSAIIPFLLAKPAAHILPSEVIDGAGPEGFYGGGPLPTAGPFQIESLDQNQITLSANPHYIGEQPSTKTLVFRKIPDPAARLLQVRGGELDFAVAVSSKQIGELSGEVEVSATPAVNGAYYVAMNNRDGHVLSDVRIRRAIALAMDRDQINKVALGGRSNPLLGLLASSSQYSKPFLSATPDVAGAKELLVGTACEDGCKFRYVTASDDEVRSDTAVVVQQNLKEIGIEVSIQKVEKAVMNEMGGEGDFDLISSGIYATADYPDGFVKTLLGPEFNGFGTGYSNPEMNEQIEILRTTSGSERQAAIDRIHAMFERDLPMAPAIDYGIVSASRVPHEVFHIEPCLNYHVG